MAKYEPLVIEPEILEFWEKNQVHNKANEKNKGKEPFYFLDGPPYTSGKVHIGTAWNKSLKDMLIRFKRMAGFDVWDRAGYDMHGLPTAHAVEKKFGIKHKEEIPGFGMAKFVEECKKLSVENMKVMNEDFKRLAVWMDFENAYQSIKSSFVEGVWWVVKKAEENKRLYEGLKSMHWCAKCGTALAKHELEYKNIEDDSIFLKFKVVGKENEYLIIWTTTPWTIPYNLGVMVHPELDYVKAKVDDEVWIVSKGLLAAFLGLINKKYEILEEFKGEKLEGMEYTHPLESEINYKDMKKDHPKVHTVVMSTEYVDLSAGTGLVHLAPGCGPEDFEIGRRNNIPTYNNLDENGRFPDNMGKFSGWVAKTDDGKFIEDLKERGCLIESTRVEHEYAHCWRCKSPVIFKTTKQWFFKVEDLKEKMRELNRKVKWVPGWAGSAQFDSWLDNLRDNGITRQRYWGTPVPIWICDTCKKYDVIGSVKELQEKAGKLPEDLHIPWIDEITYPCACDGTMKRLPDILDVWIDAGTTSWTCLDYPQKTELFEKLWPSDFILEGKDQIRGWFNLLLIASMLGMGKHSYKAVYMHGFVQDAQGRKMSKSLGNYILPEEVIEKYGADAFRFYSIGGTSPGHDLNYNFDDMKVKYRNLTVLWNLQNFVVNFAKEQDVSPLTVTFKKDLGLAEKYILSKLNSTIIKVTELMNEYELNQVPLLLEDLFLELSRTYIQLVREKAALGDEEDKKMVLHTVFTVLLETLKMFAIVCPFISEKIHLNLKDNFNIPKESIHLYDWPKAEVKYVDEELEQNIAIMQNVIQAALAAREKAHLGVRWPVAQLIVTAKDEKTKKAVAILEDLIKKQTNIKEIKVMDKFDQVKENIKLDCAKLGPDYGDLTPKIVAHFSMRSPQDVLAKVEKDGKYEFDIDKKKIVLVKEHLIHMHEVPKGFFEASFSGGFVYLDSHRTEALDAEGFSREVMRRIQSQRKKAGLQKTDRISLFIKTDEELKNMLKTWEDTIKTKVGASVINISTNDPAKEHKNTATEKVKGKEFFIYFDKVKLE